MPASIIIPMTGCDLRLWMFTMVPDEACIECHTCNAKYSMDKLRGVAVRHASSRNTAQVNVYCCIRPAIAGARSIDTLARAYGVDCSAAPATPEQPELQSDDAEREPAVCRWCKGAREITINFKTKPCDCVKQEDTGCVGWADIGRGWRVKHTFTTRA